MSFVVTWCDYENEVELMEELSIDYEEIPYVDFETLYCDNPNRLSNPPKKIIGLRFIGTNAYDINMSIYSQNYYYRFYPNKRFDIYRMPVGVTYLPYTNYPSWYYDPYGITYTDSSMSVRKDYRIKAIPILTQDHLDIYNSTLGSSTIVGGDTIEWKDMYNGDYVNFELGDAIMNKKMIATSTPLGITIVTPSSLAETEEVNLENIKLRTTFQTYE